MHHKRGTNFAAPKRDAEQAGDREMIECFNRVIEREAEDLQQLRSLLASRLS